MGATTMANKGRGVRLLGAYRQGGRKGGRATFTGWKAGRKMRPSHCWPSHQDCNDCNCSHRRSNDKDQTGQRVITACHYSLSQVIDLLFLRKSCSCKGRKRSDANEIGLGYTCGAIDRSRKRIDSGLKAPPDSDKVSFPTVFSKISRLAGFCRLWFMQGMPCMQGMQGGV